MSRLPEESSLAQPAGQDRTWSQTHELLATAVEVLSVSAAQHALKKPITVPRPHIKTRYIDRDKWEAVEKARGAVDIGEAIAGLGSSRAVRRTAPAPAPGSAP